MKTRNKEKCLLHLKFQKAKLQREQIMMFLNFSSIIFKPQKQIDKNERVVLNDGINSIVVSLLKKKRINLKKIKIKILFELKGCFYNNTY